MYSLDKTDRLYRKKILQGLMKLTPESQLLFKRMYSHKDLDKSLEEVVDLIPPLKLDWALNQVERTLEKASTTQKVKNRVKSFINRA